MNRFAAHNFTHFEHIPFNPELYSSLKFGDGHTAVAFGHELAIKFFQQHAPRLFTQDVVVIPSPYNHIQNAATLMTKAFVDKLNDLLIHANGSHVEYSVVHRKVTYTNDYGFLPKEKRGELLANDVFYLNNAFYEGKTLIFVDDIRITGTHEDKIHKCLSDQGLVNDVMYLYYAIYDGEQAEIEAQLNFASSVSVEMLANNWIQDPKRYKVIVRPTKFILGADPTVVMEHLPKVPKDILRELYFGSLAEGYYKVPKYQHNLQLIKSLVV